MSTDALKELEGKMVFRVVELDLNNLIITCEDGSKYIVENTSFINARKI